MRRFILLVCAPLAFFLSSASVRADGYTPWYSIVAARHNNYPKEMARINGFCQGYYGSLQNFYGNLSNLDWVSYYKNHGYVIGSVPGACGGPCHYQIAPVFVSPATYPIAGTIEPPPGPPEHTLVPPSAPMFYPEYTVPGPLQHSNVSPEPPLYPH
jgi:hypothetical protein